MADGSGGAPGAVAEAITSFGGKALGTLKDEIGKDVKSAASQAGLPVVQQQKSQQPQKSTQQMAAEDKAKTAPKIANIEQEFRNMQNPQNQSPEQPKQMQQNQPEQKPQQQSPDSNLKYKLHQDVQRWDEEALQKRKQEEEQRKQMEEAEEQRKKEEEEQKKLSGPVELPGSARKGPGAMGKKPKTPIALHQAQTKTESGRNNSG